MIYKCVCACVRVCLCLCLCVPVCASDYTYPPLIECSSNALKSHWSIEARRRLPLDPGFNIEAAELTIWSTSPAGNW